jgi:predicted RNA-binding Zn-ribbon protein involved in translation (DUF1610 family)
MKQMTQPNVTRCHFCDHAEANTIANHATASHHVVCPSCGEYTISDSVLSTAAAKSPEWLQAKPVLANAARRRFDANARLSLHTEADWQEALREEAAKSQG